ncbi:MAG: hypothetical protein J6O40_05770 [Ruminococcus sp.]|nr:hypothetical protein [Ruminococcus sp.]
MIVLYIILGLIALIVILLHFSITVSVSADKQNGVKISAKYLFLTLYPRKPKAKKAKKGKAKSEPQGEIQPLDEAELEAELARLDREDLDDFDELFDDDAADDENSLPTVDSIEPQSKKEAKAKAKQEKQKAKEAKKAAKQQKHKKDHQNKQKNDPESRGGIGGLVDKFNYYKPLFPMGWKYFKKLLKAIRIYDTELLLVTAKQDAYESAMFYGKLQAALNNALALICGIFTVRLKSVGVKCEFNDDKLDYYAGCKVRLRPSTVIAIAVCVLINYLLFRFKKKKEAKKNKPEVKPSEQYEQQLSA